MTWSDEAMSEQMGVLEKGEPMECELKYIREPDRSLDSLQRHLDGVVNPTWNFSGRLETVKDHFLNAVVGLAAEAGELLDVHKKIWFHTGKNLATEHKALLSEHGDVIYYWLKSLDLHGLTIEEVLDYNRTKLTSRHPELGKVTERFGPEAIVG